ncbi:MAG: hypothetical protein QOH87_1, partial [Trebonia sp.]|nr:hypothetical protein [Trebonia sp.]
MCTADAVQVSGDAFNNASDALGAVGAAMDYLNSASDLEGAACGELLIGLAEIQAKLTAAHARFLRRFDSTNAHDADGYGSSSAWLAAKVGMSKKAARASVRQMRQLGVRPLLDTALTAGDITDSVAFTIADWTRKLPGEMRDETDRILLDAAAAGASLEDLATIAACAIEKWRQQQPDPGNPDDGFDDRFVQAGTTFGGAGVIRGNLTPECAAAVRAVLEALGKKAGPEDDRTEGKRFHDALQLACELLLRARLVPDRAGADTQVIAHIPLSQLRAMPGAGDLQDAWIRARLGEDGYLTGKDAEAAACDAPAVPVVTGTIDPAVIDQMIDLARTASQAQAQAQAGAPDPAGPTDGDPGPAGPGPARSQGLSPEAWRALRYAMVRLAVDLVSGPAGVAAILRQGLLQQPYNTPSLPLDIGYSDSIPWHIRRAVLLRDRKCAWPRCHDVCIHRHGWQLTLHPDGTTQARSPNGKQILHSHAPPAQNAA